MREALSVELDLVKIQFKNPGDKIYFLGTLYKSTFEWIRENIGKIELGEDMDPFILDLNDLPFAEKDITGSKDTEEVRNFLNALANCTDSNLRAKVALCMYTDRSTLEKLAEDTELVVSKIAKFRLA